ncbi:MAG: hypothetical protein J6Y57_03460 [Lachnospiraceae bacterium]|nr:hypothetical protein [Lachnospiraceae bacterium]
MIRLEQINARNVWKFLELTVSEEQKSFVARNDAPDIAKGNYFLWRLMIDKDYPDETQ